MIAETGQFDTEDTQDTTRIHVALKIAAVPVCCPVSCCGNVIKFETRSLGSGQSGTGQANPAATCSCPRSNEKTRQSAPARQVAQPEVPVTGAMMNSPRTILGALCSRPRDRVLRRLRRSNSRAGCGHGCIAYAWSLVVGRHGSPASPTRPAYLVAVLLGPASRSCLNLRFRRAVAKVHRAGRTMPRHHFRKDLAPRLTMS